MMLELRSFSETKSSPSVAEPEKVINTFTSSGLMEFSVFGAELKGNVKPAAARLLKRFKETPSSSSSLADSTSRFKDVKVFFFFFYTNGAE